MSSVVVELLAEAFGLPASDARVRGVVAALEAARILDRDRVERLDRDRKIDRLRGAGMTVPELSARFGLDKSTCHRAIQRQLELRRNLSHAQAAVSVES